MLTTRRAEKSSSFKKALFSINKGDVIEAEGPEGDFVVEDYNREHVFIAGGVGITPYRSILMEADHNDKPINITLLYGNRSQDFVYKDTLDKLEDKHENFNIQYFVDPERITKDDLEAIEEKLSNPVFWISGPEPMVKAISKEIVGLGVEKDRVKHD